MYNEQVVSQITFEIQQIDKLLMTYKNVLEKSIETKPDMVEMTAIAAVLHSFYNGLENIFNMIAKRIDLQIYSGEQWHRTLLSSMAMKTDKRSPVISEDLKEKILNYMGFRHFFRHSYSFFLEWDELSKLVLPLNDVWEQIKNELNQFLTKAPG